MARLVILKKRGRLSGVKHSFNPASARVSPSRRDEVDKAAETAATHFSRRPALLLFIFAVLSARRQAGLIEN